MARTYIPSSVNLAHRLLLYLIRYQVQLIENMDDIEKEKMNALITCLEAFIAVNEIVVDP